MKPNKLAPSKNTAQAMVEFAIVLPILLVLLYGLLEAGRLLFMYSSIVTASRQAVRYGAATGDGTTAGIPRFLDCAGIRQAANRVDYLSAFDHTGDDIEIFWDDGPDDTTPTEICTPGKTSEDVWTGPSNNTTRLVVRVRGHFNAIVRLVPFPTRNIDSTSRRTILRSVAIVIPNPAGDTTAFSTAAGDNGTSPNPSQPGQTVTAKATVTNTSGTDTPTGTVEVEVGGTVLCTITLSGGTGSCDIVFNTIDNHQVTYTYIPDSTDFQAPSPLTFTHTVINSNTITTVTDTPNISLVGEAVYIHVVVANAFGGSVPTGTIAVTTAAGNCTITLDATGQGNCGPIVYNDLGITIIKAVYGGDTQHEGSEDTTAHEVLANPPTATIPPPPTLTFTAAPPATATFTPTPAATPVVGCSNITVPTGQTINVSGYTMSLNIYNPMTYNITIKDVFLRWNYLQGFNGHDLHLVSAQLNSSLGTNLFWGPGDVHAPSYSPPLNGKTVTIPASSMSTIVFTFHKLYTRPLGEQIQISFSTPGCEDHTINIIK